ncbi:hypothetical protein ACH5RR_031939 [Cinchona calisaya]|uniref:Uncharacterized protein n=1 Tax=Cinchona calisaya TaxID=153742 RepID=A0ABD2YJP6_9GENT
MELYMHYSIHSLVQIMMSRHKKHGNMPIRIMAPRQSKQKQVMASHEETHKELEVQFDTDRVEGPYGMHDDGQESDDPKLNRPTGGFLSDACRVALIQQSLVQLAHHPQPSPTRREKDVEKCFVVMSKIGVSMFDGAQKRKGVHHVEAKSWDVYSRVLSSVSYFGSLYTSYHE